MGKNERYSVGLDIGTTKICCVVAEIADNGTLHVVGMGEAESQGLRKGVVVNPNATVDAVKKAVEQAEQMSELDVESATIGIAGGHIRSFNSRGVVSVSGRDRTVTEDDKHRVLDAARAVSIPQDREILHVLTQEFRIDDQGGIASPVGLVGSHLEANVHIVTGSGTSVQNLVSCVNRAGLEVRDTVLEQLAASYSAFNEDETELGVALIDIGGGTTDLAIFEKGSIWHTAVLPVGGDHFTNDLAIGLRARIVEAEKLKTQYGCALATMVDEKDAVEVPTMGGRQARLLSLRVMAEILQPRAEEIFALIRDEIGRAGFGKTLNAGIVLTGGGSLLAGMLEVAEQVFDSPVRIGTPNGVEGLIDPTSGPQHSTAVGLALYGARHRRRAKRPTLHPGATLGRVSSWMRSRIMELF